RAPATADLVHELAPGAPGQRCDANPAVAVLAAAAGLLLVLPLALALPPERLAIGDSRLRSHGVHAVLPGQPAHDDLEMPLAQPADQRLLQLRVVLVRERGVLLVQLAQAVRQLLLLAALLHPGRHAAAGRRPPPAA